MHEIWETYKRELLFFICLLALFFLFKYLLIYVGPFVLAYLIYVAIFPTVKKINQKTRIPESAVGVILLLVGILLAFVIIFFFAVLFLQQATAYFGQISQMWNMGQKQLCECCRICEEKMGLHTNSIYPWVTSHIFTTKGSFFQKGMNTVMQKSVSCVKPVGVGLAFLFVTVIGTYLLFKEKQADWVVGWNGYTKSVLAFFKAYIKAQAKIVFVIILICFIGFSLSKVRTPFFWACITAILELMPFIGTGIIVFPLLIWKILCKYYFAALILVITYFLCILARQLLEPKLLSGTLGISPFFMLAGIYIGIKVFGVSGIILGPIYVMLASSIYHKFYDDVS